MDVMDRRVLMGRVLAQMAQGGAKITNGTYTPTETSAYLTLDTGVTGWNHFLITVSELPYNTDESLVRAIGLRYANLDANFTVFNFASSNGQQLPSNGNSGTGVVNAINKNTGVITNWGGAAASYGNFIKGVQYEWFCW